MAETQLKLTSVKKHMIALYLKGSTDYFRIEKSTDLQISMNPETETRDFIADESPTEILKQYKPSIEQSLTMFKGNPDYEEIFTRFYDMRVGEAAVSDAMIVFKQEKTADGVFKAWQNKATVTVQSMDTVAETITFTISFNGTVRRGTTTFTDGKPVFTETPETPAVMSAKNKSSSMFPSDN